MSEDPYEELCNRFVNLIEEATDEEFLSYGITISTPKWDVLLLPNEEELVNSTVSQLKEPLTTLFSVRRDLFTPVVESRNEGELLRSLHSLYSWLSLRGYGVRLRGNTFVSRFKFDMHRGLSKVLGWVLN